MNKGDFFPIKNSRRVIRVVLIIFVFLMAAVAYVGQEYQNTLATYATGRTEGVVVQVSRANVAPKSFTGDYHYTPRVQFVAADGKEYVFTSTVGVPAESTYLVGQKVAVRYDPNDPALAEVDSGEVNNAMYSLGIGGVIFFTALLSLSFVNWTRLWREIR